jgi:hypothetical protein
VIRVVAAALLIVTAANARPDEPVINEALRLYSDAVEEATKQLKTVRDAASAKNVAEALRPFDETIAKQLARLNQAANREEPGGAIQRHSAAVTAELETQWRRAAGIPGTKVELEKLTAIAGVATTAGKLKRQLAEAGIKSLYLATKAYEIKYGEPPADLSKLMAPPDSKKPFIEKEWLTDPWSRPYHYDPKGPKNKGDKPDIWSTGPDPNDPNGVIGNWPVKKDN